MKPKIYIDGEHGTTGLQIKDRLAGREDIDIISIPEAQRRNAELREKLLTSADVAILCLPDDAAREAVRLAGDSDTRFIDASTAHRTHPDWVFGFAEIDKGQAERIAAARFVSNPGCYSTGAIALLRPLVVSGVMAPDYPVTINAVSGYTGGGKNLIAQMEDPARPDAISSNYYVYGLNLAHKHVPEIITRAGLARRPVFSPGVGRYAQGMIVQLPLHLDFLKGAPTMESIHDTLCAHYAGQDVVTVVPLDQSSGLARLDPEALNGTDRMELFVFGTPGTGQVNLAARLDNLGKGASGAAVQNLNLMLGLAR